MEGLAVLGFVFGLIGIVALVRVEKLTYQVAGFLGSLVKVVQITHQKMSCNRTPDCYSD